MRKSFVTALIFALILSCCAFAGCTATENKSFRISFVNYDETVLYETDVKSGEAVSYNGETPVKPSDDEFDYSFAGWAGEDGIVLAELPVAGKDATYKATFNGTKRSYTASFVVDGETIKTVSLKYGTVITYDEAAPIKAGTAQYSYSFKGWKIGETVYEAELPAITANVTLTAVFDETVNSYTVTFINGENRTPVTANYGSAPSYTGSEPTKAATEDYHYTFVGWAKTENGETTDLSKETVTGDITYYAIFSETRIRFTVRWITDGKETSSYASLDSAPVYGGEQPVKAASAEFEYTFKGWSKTQDGETVDLSKESVTADVTYYAVFAKTTRSYEIKFVVNGVETAKTFLYNAVPSYGETEPAKDSTETADYVFAGWATEEGGNALTTLPAVTGADTYYAVFTEVRTNYIIKWIVNGKETSALYQKDTVPAYDGETPVKADDELYTYTFAGWATEENGEVLSSVPAATADVTYYAVFEAKKIQFALTVSYVYENGGTAAENKTVLIDKNAVYGKELTESPEIEGYLPDNFWFSGIMTGNKTETVTYKTADVWDGTTVAEGYESGDGTEENPYIIKTAAQLKYMQSQYSGAKSQTYAKGLFFRLAANLDMTAASWTPIANRGVNTNSGWSYFGGNLDGNGYVVKLTAGSSSFNGAALFEGISGTVKNLVVAGTVQGSTRAASVAYTANTGFVIENVKNFASITTSNAKEAYTGGILGMTKAAGTIKNCVNYASVTAGATYCGGIVGYTSNTLEITGCVNYGTITTAANGAGGIAGGEAKNGGATYTNCYNYGTVIGVSKVGGIIGSSYTATVTTCYNYGLITTADSSSLTKSNTGFGGIIGWTTTNSSINSCVNYGEVNSYTNVGGITGYLGAGSTISDDCSNHGKITATDTKCSGEIIGYDANNA